MDRFLPPKQRTTENKSTKERCLANYLQEFDRKLLEAGGQNWDDVIEINMLSSHLDFELLNRNVDKLTRKDSIFQWNDEANAVFERLKQMFITAPILTTFDPDRQAVLETDSSGYPLAED
ncbi:uncharacterized protein PADG_06389 [Paracoccidioides brasiliensis Pb18]|uniref:Reverse transcriptase/retrotransposon-derived protein RNase H-like domain-containing protein n=1 Tax=Paracoccidioides brasiliensis (strain Pb18) TaxID=502780 RepID=C1GGF2_PARBD|nr:uncharacterized protein PADG_06389 [Paracoccidioides brasiliensis Pb18]EEH50310.2 hypothetical protein PADG_06389 [Paracoccidioides brasiliensis Pb18]